MNSIENVSLRSYFIPKFSIFLLRIAIGALFLYSGINKLMNDFSAAGYLTYATKGPFQEFFASLAGNSFIDFIVVWGEIGIGLSMVFGVLLRFGSICGILMMLGFYFSALWPEHGPINDQIIYCFVFLALALNGAGRYLGVDHFLERLSFVKKIPGSKFLLG